MKRPKLRETKRGPEAYIQEALIKFLELRGWTVMETHGNLYQSGFPDLYCIHEKHKQRWVEVKNPRAYVFTPAQLECFPKINRVVGVWILTSATEIEYNKLFGPPNWYQYLEVHA